MTVAATLVSLCATGAILYWAQTVLVPLALAAFITFLLAPFVMRLQAAGFPRVVAVLTVVTLGTAATGIGGWMVFSQLADFTERLPQYRQNISEKVADIKQLRKGGFIDRVTSVMQDVSHQLEPQHDSKTTSSTAPESIPVIVKEENSSSIPTSLPAIAGGLIEHLGMALLVLVLVIFMLLDRENLRNRVVGFAGRSYLAVTTAALDDAGRRISRYLLMQLLVNASFGLVLCAGLLVMRVPYALLWGALAAVLRYVPYVGPWVAAILPVVLSAVVFKGWVTPLMVIGLFLVLDLFCVNALEPRLYGHTIGVSEVALLISAVFWTWLWGPVGLVLATPLTIYLVILGQYVPGLAFVKHLLGDQPVLEPHLSFYQRLLAHDDDEAAEILDKSALQNTLETSADTLIVPALEVAKRDHERGDLDDEQVDYIARTVVDLVDVIHDSQTLAGLAGLAAVEDGDAEAADARNAEARKVADAPNVIGFGVHGDVDRAALEVFSRTLSPQRCNFSVLSRDVLISELIAAANREQPVALCLASLPPDGITHVKHLSRRLRAACPNVKLFVGRWGAHSLSPKAKAELEAAGVDYVASTLQETRAQLNSLLQISGSPAVVRPASAVNRRIESQHQPV